MFICMNFYSLDPPEADYLPIAIGISFTRVLKNIIANLG
jgi:hypothetical protein